MPENHNLNNLASRFRGFYPVVIDVETSGFDAKTNALLEIAAVTLKMTPDGWLEQDQILHFHVEPFEGAVLQTEALSFNGIDPYSPLRDARNERQVLQTIFKTISKGMKDFGCQRAIVAAHNATFDHTFIMTAAERAGLKRNPFHPFATLDTAALSALVLGQTVLARACRAAGFEFDQQQAHSAHYDASQTARLFCELVNRWKRLGGWPPGSPYIMPG